MRWNRREFVAASAAALTWPAWNRSLAAVITKKIPSSGEPIPVVGLGTRNFRAGPGDDRGPFRETLRAFVAGGGRVIDTAPSYGNSESVLGALLTELDLHGKVFLATKVDRPGAEAGVARMEASLQALEHPKVDLMQVHNLTDAATQLATLRDWKAQGRIRYLGVTTSFDGQYADLEALMRRETLDFVQLDYALDERQVADRLLPLAQDRGMAVLVNLPFGRGRLFQKVGDRPLPDWAAEFECRSWAQLFLKYVVSHPAVTCAIPGMTKAAHVTDNLGAAAGRLPDGPARRRMEQWLDGL